MPQDNIINLNQKRLFKALESFPANSIYSMGPKKYVERGFNYYKKNSLLDFKWSGDFSTLTAIVYGNRHYSIDISPNGNDLSLFCDCPAWTPYTHCKHVICTLITIKNLFQSSSFRNPAQDAGHRESLSRIFFGTSASALEPDIPVEYSIVLELSSYVYDIYVQGNDQKIYPYMDGIPDELKTLAAASYYKLSFFRQYLANYGNKHPIFIQSVKGKTALEFDKSLSYSSKTELDDKGSFVSIRKLCMEKGKETGDVHIENDLIIDFNAGKIGFLNERNGWDLWNNLSEFTCYDNDFIPDEPEKSFGISAEKFRKIQIVFQSLPSQEGTPDNMVLRIRGRECPSVKASHTYRATIFPAKYNKDVFIIKAECNLNGLIQSPSYNFFNFFASIDHKLSSFLRAIKRKKFLYRAFFNMISARTKTAGLRTIKDVLSEGDFKSASIKREARSFLHHHLSVFLRDENQLQLHDGSWIVSRVDKGKEALLYSIPYEIFGWEIFRNVFEHNEMFVSSGNLHENLPLLYERFREHNIELYFKNSRVVESKWDFAFHADRTAGIDWFEIKPEIKCDGKLIDESEWIEMLRNKTLAGKDGAIRIMDSNARKIFDIISTIYSAGNPSAANAKEKEIVRVPRLQILDWIELRRSGVRVKLPPEDDKIIERLGRLEKINTRPLPSKLTAKLRPYQKEGYYWLSFLYEHRFGACLADDMGLGKTVQAIALLGGIKEGLVRFPGRTKPSAHLIVVPPTLLFNWEHEINKFCPGLKIHMYTGKDRETNFEGHDIVLTTYGLVRRDIETLKDIRFDVIIFDEAQAIKNIYADTTGAVRRLSANFSLAVTGTPLENHVGEYYSIIDLVLPGLLGEHDKFRPLIKQNVSPALDMIINRTRPFVLRRTKDKILRELPPKIENDIYLELTEKQKTLYKKTVEQVKSKIDDAYKSKTSAQAKIIALTAILKLRQLCVSPVLISGDTKEPSPKIDFLITKLKELQDEGHSALIFSQFTSFLDILEKDLKKIRMDFLRLDGSTPVGKRKQLIGKFQSEKGPSIFLLSLKAGGQGLNLTKASYVFHLDPWWNPAVENQASDRAHRIGQKNKVTITRILTHHTIEEKMMHLKKKKLALYKAVMDDTKGNKKSLSVSRSDFNFLLN
jgi:non-specific serine/threonine protein kinase